MNASSVLESRLGDAGRDRGLLADPLQATIGALENSTDFAAFETRSVALLNEIEPTIHHRGGSGDLALDGAGGAWIAGSTDIAVLASIERNWAAKIRRELTRLDEFDHPHSTVIAATSRRATTSKRRELETLARNSGRNLVVLDAHWFAVRLLQRQHWALRSAWLALPNPSPAALLTASELRSQLARALGGTLPPLTGRSRLQARIAKSLRDGQVVVLEGPGGIGKTRVSIEPEHEPDRAVSIVVLTTGSKVEDRDLRAELGLPGPFRVVIDDAHRRADLKEVLSLLGRREQSTEVVLTVRPGFELQIRSAVSGSGLEHVSWQKVGRLSGKQVGRLIRACEPKLEYDAAVDRAVRLSSGDPLIAILAHRRAVSGASSYGITRDDLMRTYVADRVATAAARLGSPSATIEHLAGLVALAGTVSDRHIAVSEALTGLAPAQTRQVLDGLADAGLLSGDGTQAAPFVVVPHVVAGVLVERCFLVPGRTRRFADAWNAWAEVDPEACAGGLASVGLLPVDEYRQALQVVEATARSLAVAEPARGLALAGSLAQAVPWAASAVVEECLSLDARQLPTRDWLTAIEVLAGRHPHPDEAWPLVLQALLKFFRSDPADDDRERLRNAVDELHSRIPVNSSAHDGEILAAIQRAWVTGLQEFVRELDVRGWDVASAQAAATAATVLLRLEWDRTSESAEDERVVHIGQLRMPASEFTDAALHLGAKTMAIALPLIPQSEARRSLDALGALRHLADGGLRGSHEPNPALQRLARSALAAFVEHVGPAREALCAPLRFELESTVETSWGDVDVAEYGAVVGVSRQRLERDDNETERRDVLARYFWPDALAAIARWHAWIEEARTAGLSYDLNAVSLLLTDAADSNAAMVSDALQWLCAHERHSEIWVIAGPAVRRILDAAPQLRDQLTAELMKASSSTRSTLALSLSHRSLAPYARRVLAEVARDIDYGPRSAVVRAVIWPDCPDWLALAAAEACSDGDPRLIDCLLRWWEEAQDRVFPHTSELRAAVVAGAARPEGVTRMESYRLRSVLEMLEPVSPGTTMEWLWARVEAAAADPSARPWGPYYLPFDDRLRGWVARCATDTDRERALAIRLVSDPTEAHRGRQLLEWTDDGGPWHAEWIAKNAHQLCDPRHQIADEMLGHDISWPSYLARARTVLGGGAPLPRAGLNAIVRARVPNGWSGSEANRYRELLDAFERDSREIPEPLLAEARAYLGARIRDAEVRDRDDE